LSKKSNLLVVGLVRNSAKSLAREVTRLSDLMSSFYQSVDFYVVESDSSDITVDVLHHLTSSMPNFKFETLGKLEKSIPNRIERLRYCRNRYITQFREVQNLNGITYSEILVVDFDIRNKALKLNDLSRLFSLDFEWAALFANQKGRYFDIYALRHDSWMPTDCFTEVTNLIEKGLSSRDAKQIAIWSKMRKIYRDKAPIPVKSAFGGMGLYKSWVFDKFDYSINETPLGATESEHVALHHKIQNAGGSMYILPWFTNFGWNPHNLASFRSLRFLDKVTKTKVLKPIRQALRSLLG
jgi:hypothetical protein